MWESYLRQPLSLPSSNYKHLLLLQIVLLNRRITTVSAFKGVKQGMQFLKFNAIGSNKSLFCVWPSLSKITLKTFIL